MPVSTVLLLASIGVLSLFCQWLAWRVRMPAILFLLAGGIAAGPVLGFLAPEAVFGDLLFPVIQFRIPVPDSQVFFLDLPVQGVGLLLQGSVPLVAIL